ncbi:reprolysin-like metallopeptidase [Alteromonas oceanisediminis]|uniref:reprolysin-like metallopeptidase n=1 Tax=Alteromonas oceanisediminis TaxID=2836180 RepID=UPI001BDADCD8|nr:M12 family metallo-peptidase [Alteromonas oceanisediminis]MBT0585335.1 hypothetical protein [Alteromonas oceanisediminis]
MTSKRTPFFLTACTALTFLISVGFAWGAAEKGGGQTIFGASSAQTFTLNSPKPSQQGLVTFTQQTHTKNTAVTAIHLPFLIEHGMADTTELALPAEAMRQLSSTHRFISHKYYVAQQPFTLYYTQGIETGMGEIIGAGERLYFEWRGDEVKVVDVAATRTLPSLYENDVANPHEVGVLSAEDAAHLADSALTQQMPIMVDTLLLFTPNIVERYPGAMTQTLLNHLIAKANQTFVNSDINMQLRLVGDEFVNYTRPSSLDALTDLFAALDNDNSTQPDPSLNAVRARRNALGADLVAMIRTHDLNEREVCGVARFPSTQSDVLANISNVGISGGSNCVDTFTHEVGHNFGAGHQQRNGESVGSLPFSGALIVSGQYNTIMSSIGTGDENRNLGLAVFSNTNNNCGGDVCGNASTADNARTVNAFAAQNAALRAQVVPGSVQPPPKQSNDTDGDGTIDENDHFPFLASERDDDDNDGVGNNTDAFPNDASETLDTDGDGVGNNSDTDDDNDDVPDSQDDLPLDNRDSVDADADGFGVSRDALDNNFQEQFDADNDGVGDLADNDDDNDGVPDYFPAPTIAQSQMIVASADTHQLLAYRADSGDFVEVMAEVAPGGITFRSAVIEAPNNLIYFIAFSDVLQHDRLRNTTSMAIPRTRLATNFPVHLAAPQSNRLLVNNGLGNSFVESFGLTAIGNTLTASTSSSEIWRGLAVVRNNLAYVVSRSTQQVLSFNPQQSDNAFNVLVNNGLEKPEHLVVDSQGNLYISDVSDNTVRRFNAQGQSLGTFVSAGSGGLATPGCLAFGPEGQLYVCSLETHQVLRFDGASGAFIDVAVESGEGGLARPVSVAFVSDLADEFPYDPNHDSDNDGVLNPDDDLPLDPNETTDTDGDGIGNNADEDDDGDGMPDSFENDNGFDPLDPSDATEDADGDGVSNVDEFVNGTDPNVADAPAPSPEPPTPPPGNNGGGGSSGLWVLLGLSAALWQRRRAKANRSYPGSTPVVLDPAPPG